MASIRESKSQFRTPKWLLGVAMAAGGLSALACWATLTLYVHDRNTFRRTVYVGMNRDEVKMASGEPDQKLAPGSRLPVWGSTPSRMVNGETWIYFVFPKSQHRFVLTFKDNELAQVDYDPN